MKFEYGGKPDWTTLEMEWSVNKLYKYPIIYAALSPKSGLKHLFTALTAGAKKTRTGEFFSRMFEELLMINKEPPLRISLCVACMQVFTCK